MDRSNFLEALISFLAAHKIRYCVIGGVAVNAYAEPVVTLDLDLVVAVDQLPEFESILTEQFTVERFPHSLNIKQAGSDLRVQIQTDPRYASFLHHAEQRDVLGLTLPVASVEDVLQGKVWAARDASRRPSKRLKDLTDIARILENHPHLANRVPPELQARLSQL